jgi:signal transduction histidine kinase/DNA-binding response OmpR family regulator/CHASE3 domain sensor protein
MIFKRKQGLASSISYWTTAIITISTIAILTIGIVFNAQNKQIGEDIEIQFNEQLQVQELERTSQAIVSSYRGYIAYGRTEFLDETFVEIESMIAKMDHLRSTMAGREGEDPRKIDAAAYVQTMWRELSNQMQVGIDAKKKGDAAAIETLSQTKVTPMIDSVNARFSDLMKLQEERVQQLLGKNKSLGNWLLLIPFATILFSCAMGYYLVYYMRKIVIAPVMYMNKMVSLIAAGDYVEVETSGRKDELGSLQRGIRRMSEELRKWAAENETYNRELINQRDLLEVQNEEITAQQEEQHETLLKLTARERELELITTYQERLAGYLDMLEFMESTIPVLLQVLHADAAAVVLKNRDEDDEAELVYSTGYSEPFLQSGQLDLYGPAKRVFSEKKTLIKKRHVSGSEKGVHGYYGHAADHYVPLLGNDQRVYGFLLLTTYFGERAVEDTIQAGKGVVNQFSLAMHAQVLNAERLKQTALLERLHTELLLEKQLIQEQRDFTRQVNESIHEGMLICNSDGRVVFANGRMKGYFGYTVQDGDTLHDFSRHINKLNHGAPLALEDTVNRLLQEESGFYQERFTVEWAQGTRYYEMYANAVEGTELIGKSFLFVFRDRSDEEKADEIKNEFVSIVSHELRTPLSSVLGFIEILLNRQVSPDKQKRYLETIHSEAGRLSTLINDFLDLQRMEAGKQVYQPVPCSIGELVGTVSEQWEEKQGHSIRLDTPPEPLMASADVDRIKQVLHNLISNAIKYSPQAEYVDISCSLDGEFVRIDVKDYGLGIPDDAKEKLFSKFFRVDNTDRRQIGGTGLGLAIVKEIVEAHEGRLSFDSQLGQGSTFTVWLPVYTPQDLSGKVVIVEDDANLAKMLAVSFEKLQIPTVCLSSAEDAVYSMNHSPACPVICIVDIQLKGVKSGWDFISELLKHPLHNGTPVIVTTVLEQPNHFYETNKERYLQKPFTIDRMLELVKLLISESQSGAPFVFPVQDKQIITDSLQHNGITVKEIKVKTDFIEVDIEKDENNRI